MIQKRIFRLSLSLLVISLILNLHSSLLSQSQKALTIQDMMKFKHISNSAISNDGSWVAYTANPDRGDGEVFVHSANGKKTFRIERGARPFFSGDGNWVATSVQPPFSDSEKKNGKDAPKQGLALLNTQTGETIQFENVQKFDFSENSKWLAYSLFEEKNKADKKVRDEKPSNSKNSKGKKAPKTGTDLILRELKTGTETVIPFVDSFSMDSTSQFLVLAIADTAAKNNGLYFINLNEEELTKQPLLQMDNTQFENFTWFNKDAKIAFLVSEKDTTKKQDVNSIWFWEGLKSNLKFVLHDTTCPDGWYLPSKNRLAWSKDGEELYFGLKPLKDRIIEKPEKKEEEKEADIYDVDALLEKRGVDVWHWNDPRIKPHDKKLWPQLKDRTFQAVYFIEENKLVQLADETMPRLQMPGISNTTLGFSGEPYLKEITWDDSYYDIYLVDIKTALREKILSHYPGRPSLSPKGNFLAYYKDKHWYLYDCQQKATRNLTEEMDVPFYNEDHDYPSLVPGYGYAGWTEDDAAVLIYDKYDIWKFPTSGGQPVNLTQGKGRKNKIIFRIKNLNHDRNFFKNSDRLLLTAYNDVDKHFAFYEGRIDQPDIKKLLDENKKFTFLRKAKDEDVFIYTRESYTEFPDIWITDSWFKSRKKLTDLNPQVKDFAWGSAELVEWTSLDGLPLQGVLIKPGNYEKGKRYPVLVYYYRFFSQRLHEFNEVVVNHRPCFPFYASNGYAVFLPDIRFEVGRPGFAATKCLVPGVQKIIDMGVADPDAICLHGHSWSGYQTAFVITQTDMFACAIAGAPVSNMTSAYSGIRWGSGMARQFQYEQSQSRIGGSLWEYPERYIENSPVFFADKINTPLLIQFGDEDGAVPWYQGIELYLALRRLNKDCIFLQYRGEPHHLKKYPNKVDYTLKMKQYMDFYLKGEPAADWIKNGVPYNGQ